MTFLPVFPLATQDLALCELLSGAIELSDKVFEVLKIVQINLTVWSLRD